MKKVRIWAWTNRNSIKGIKVRCYAKFGADPISTAFAISVFVFSTLAAGVRGDAQQHNRISLIFAPNVTYSISFESWYFPSSKRFPCLKDCLHKKTLRAPQCRPVSRFRANFAMPLHHNFQINLCSNFAHVKTLMQRCESYFRLGCKCADEGEISFDILPSLCE